MNAVELAGDLRKQGVAYLKAAEALETLGESKPVRVRNRGKKKPAGSVKRVLSPKGRANIANAQKRRWAKLRKAA